MKSRYRKGLAGLVLITAVLGGCGSSGGPSLDSTSVYLRQDGSVASAVYEEFDTDSYSLDELRVFVEDAVRAYNQEAAGAAEAYSDKSKTPLDIAISSLEAKNGEAVLKMEYASAEDYIAFNRQDEMLTQLASGTVDGAKAAGIDLAKIELVSADGKEKLTAADLGSEYYIVFAEGTADLTVEGKIAYASEDVELDGSSKASIDSKENLSCIIYK